MQASAKLRSVTRSVMSTGKIALVTGGNRGIGKEIVRQLAAKGIRVVLTARDPEAGAQAVSEIKGDIEFLALDVADDQSIAQAADNFGKRWDRLDVLVNNAGIFPDQGFDILTVPRDLLIKTFQANTFGAIRCTISLDVSARSSSSSMRPSRW
jgi:NAD(P)-dependent dehydrogenase (short-subunit alcohol dehydrogenase family)